MKETVKRHSTTPQNATTEATLNNALDPCCSGGTVQLSAHSLSSSQLGTNVKSLLEMINCMRSVNIPVKNVFIGNTYIKPFFKN